jgi:hypothetical protein
MKDIYRRFKEPNIVAKNGVVIYSENEFVKIDSVLAGGNPIYPKYYKWTADNSVVEIWFDKTGIMVDEGYGIINKGKIQTSWHIDTPYVIDITDEFNKTKEKKGLDWSIGSSDGNICSEIPAPIANNYGKANNNGGASDWYALPKNANTLQDLIEHRNMNGSVKDIFKACYRLGIKTEDELRDLNKMAYYSLREIGRITGRKDYITIANELMGEQAMEINKIKTKD